MQVVWTEPALDGIALAYDYIFEFNPRAAMHVAHTLRAEGDSLEHFPHRGRPVPRTNMRELVSSYPYIIRYRIEGDRVIILRVRHTARRPTNL
jgi:plasmid stabilization system protein ParE